jgi:enediyne biosynthesis protein E4
MVSDTAVAQTQSLVRIMGDWDSTPRPRVVDSARLMAFLTRALSVAVVAALSGALLCAADVRIRFTEVSAAAGLTLRNIAGNPAKNYLIESTGNGVAFFDFDNDADMDVLLTNGSTLEQLAMGGHQMVALYRNDGGGRFTDVTKATGLIRLGWASGVCVADYDNDGFEDVYITAFGPNVLWRNVRGKAFLPTGQAADPGWSTGCAFGDYDRDGDVDLYVANYVKFERAAVPARGSPACRFMNIATYCGPRPLPGEPDRLYRKLGSGKFVDVTAAAGVTEPGYYGFGVLFTDLDDDGWPDIYVANDSTPNLFFRNQRNGRFKEEALAAGLAVSADGREQAGMGVDVGDLDGDGLFDLVKTNFSQDYTSLYLNDGGGLFVDASFRSGLAATLGTYLGWGVGLVDLDNDARLDLFIANGHVYPDVARTGTSSYLQRNQVFRNVGRGRLQHVTEMVGGPLVREKSSRGAAFGDFDNDGDADVLISVLDDLPMLLRNDTAGNHWITLSLEGVKSNRSAIGAKVTIEAGGRRQVAEVRSGGSYVSHNDRRVRFGLGNATTVDRISIRWPLGLVEEAKHLTADRFYTAREGTGITP